MSKHAKMLVLPDGTSRGTIGGGLLEARVLEEARHVLTTTQASLLRLDLTADQLAADGLTCGGSVEVFLEPFTPTTHLTVLKALADTYQGARNAVVATVLNPAFVRNGQHKMLVQHDGTTVGSLGDPAIDAQIVQQALAQLSQDALLTYMLDLPEHSARAAGIYPDNQLRIVLETIVPRPTALLFGGGHVSLQLSRLLPFIGFEFIVIDDRPDFANQLRFPDANACLVQAFDQAFQHLPVDPACSYVIIVTRGHQSDVVVLKQAIRANPKYIGMIGSRRKVQLLFQRLHEQGIPRELLDAVYTPIGLPIGADTPQEIAVSIAAELIQVRRS